MQFKTRKVAALKNSTHKKIAIAIMLMGILVIFLFAPVLFEKEKTIPGPKGTVVEPQFTLEGTLVFLNTAGDTLKLVDIEIADNEHERVQGMMYRSSMSYDRAMLFIMEYERPQSFWMRNTKMSLDIIYVSGDKEIVTIYKHTQPYSESPIPSFKKAKYVVETAAGFCDKFGVKEGDRIEFIRFN